MRHVTVPADVAHLTEEAEGNGRLVIRIAHLLPGHTTARLGGWRRDLLAHIVEERIHVQIVEFRGLLLLRCTQGRLDQSIAKQVRAGRPTRLA